MVTSLKLRDVKDPFQHELNDDIRWIKCSPNLFFAEYYEILEDYHQNLLHDNITKTYRKAPPKLEA